VIIFLSYSQPIPRTLSVHPPRIPQPAIFVLVSIQAQTNQVRTSPEAQHKKQRATVQIEVLLYYYLAHPHSSVRLWSGSSLHLGARSIAAIVAYKCRDPRALLMVCCLNHDRHTPAHNHTHLQCANTPFSL